MNERLRLSPQTVLVLDAFLDTPRAWRYGYDISRDTELKSGTLYPILVRLEEHEFVEACWETTEAGRPPRHMYRLTAAGVRAARELVRSYRLARGRRPSPRLAEG